MLIQCEEKKSTKLNLRKIRKIYRRLDRDVFAVKKKLMMVKGGKH